MNEVHLLPIDSNSMKPLLALAILALASCSRDDYKSSAESYFAGKETFQLESKDEFLVREPDGSVYRYDVEVAGDKGIQRVEGKVLVFGPTAKDPWEGFVLPEEKSVDGVE